jgi:hypothetical protein
MKKRNKFIEKNHCHLIVIVGVGMLNLLPLYGQGLNFIRYANQNIENSEAYLRGNIYQKDFLLFIDMLQTSHPAFAPGLDYPFDMDSIKQEGYQWASGCQSVVNLKSYLQAIATLLNDGHTTLIPAINKNLIYPFVFFKDNQHIYLRGINKTYESFLGKQILQINGHPVLEVLNSFKQAISSDNEIYFLDKVNDFMQLYSMWENNPYCLADSSLLFTFADSTTMSLHPILQKEINIAWLQPLTSSISIRENSKQPFLYKITEENICYLQFNSCSDQSTLRAQYYMSDANNLLEEELEKNLAQYHRFDVFLTEMFQVIEANKVKTLVIDVRNNTGGNSKLCDILLSWLKPLKEIKSQSSFTRFSELWEQHYPVLAAEYKQAFVEKQQTFEIGKLYDNFLLPQLTLNDRGSSVLKKIDEYFLMNTDENQIFTGNIIFIQNAKTYSSADC